MKNAEKAKKQLIDEFVNQRQRITESDRSETERNQAKEALQASHRFLQIANRHTEMIPLLNEFVLEIKNLTGCDAVGIRMLDIDGSIPYEAYEGFSQSFYESESPLSIKSDQGMCINVIKGVADPKLSFYTEGGSFYVNGTSRFLATISEKEKGRTCNVCNQVGYESVALVPIRLGDRILGLIHVADHQENMVPFELVKVLEWTTMQLGTAIQRVQAEEELRKAHDELVRANEELQRQIEERKLVEEALLEGEEKYRRLFENESDAVMIFDAETLRFEDANQATLDLYGYSREKFLALNVEDISDEKDKTRVAVQKVIRDEPGSKRVHLLYFRKKDGTIFPGEISAGTFISSGRKKIIGAVRDITERKQAENDLQEKERKLREQTKSLEEVNIALKVLLSHRDEEKERLKEGILANVQRLLVPYLGRLRDTSLTTEQKAFLDALESSLSEITSPLVNRLSSKYAGLTPREIEVASLVRVGKTNAEIADLLCISENAVSFHRKNIRAKLGLKKQKVNLRSHLQGLA